ncbi:MAG: helix-turn-helix transcriptional regulator [Chitinophagales bacterium]
MEKQLGKKVRQIRELKGYSQEYMASKLGISQRAYSKLERDEIKLNWDKITEISQIFEIDPLDLVSFDDNLIFHNCTNAGKFKKFTNYNQIPEKLIEQYEKRISSLEEEVVFLRKLVGEKA